MYQFALHWVYYRYHFILNYIFLITGSVIPGLWKFYMQKYIVVLPLSPLGFFYFKHNESWLCFITACIILNIAMIVLQDHPRAVADIWRSLKFYRWNWLFEARKFTSLFIRLEHHSHIWTNEMPWICIYCLL